VKINVKTILIYLVIAFVILSIWNSPTTTGNNVGDFLGSVGSWIGDLVDKFGEFVTGLKS
jgi:hypothetical protein